jgi:HEPN domain-containing protein
MTPTELPRNEALKWLREAEKDRRSAEALLDVEPSRAVFHAQQFAEKAIKAFLTFHQVPFRRTHDLTDLGFECAALDPTLESTLRQVQNLTDYASAFRYPDAPYEPESAEAASALALANRLFLEIQRRIVSR